MVASITIDGTNAPPMELRMHKVTCVVAMAAALLLKPAASAAQTATFMLVPGIQGESTDDRHRNWIDVSSLRQAWEPDGRRRANCVIEIAKPLDASGPPLWLAAVTGQPFGEIQIEAVRTGAERFRFFQVKLANARIVSMATAGNGSYGDTLRLDADTATLTYWPQLPDGRPGAPVSSTVACGR